MGTSQGLSQPALADEQHGERGSAVSVEVGERGQQGEHVGSQGVGLIDDEQDGEAAHGLSPTATSPEPPIETWEDYERHVMSIWWSRARKLPVAQLSEQVLRGFEDQTPALCRELLRRVEEESRQDPAFGLETAELALEQATLLKPHLDPAELASLLARAWAWLGWARRCAGDPGGANSCVAWGWLLLSFETRSRRQK